METAMDVSNENVGVAHLETTTTRFAKNIEVRVMSKSGERTRPRVQGSAPSLNPLPDVSDEGVADHTRGRVCSPRVFPMVVVSRCAHVGVAHLWTGARGVRVLNQLLFLRAKQRNRMFSAIYVVPDIFNSFQCLTESVVAR